MELISFSCCQMEVYCCCKAHHVNIGLHYIIVFELIYRLGSLYFYIRENIGLHYIIVFELIYRLGSLFLHYLELASN